MIHDSHDKPLGAKLDRGDWGEAAKQDCLAPKPMSLCEIGCGDFGSALKEMNLTDRKLFRRGWNGKGMWIKIQFPNQQSKMSLPYIYMHTADNKLIPWVPSHADLLAQDWEVVKE